MVSRVGVGNRRGNQKCMICSARGPYMLSDSKPTEASFTPISTDQLCLQHAQMPKS